MSDQAELNCIIVDNLADLEAAAHQVEEVIEPMLATEVERVVADFLAKHGWGGAFEGLDSLWVAPKAWLDPEGEEDDYVCQFGLNTVPLADAERDYFALSALTGAGLTTIGLYWSSDSVSASKLGKLVADHPEAVERLQAAGFVYDIANKRSLYLPVAIDRAQLIAGMREGSVDEAVEPLADALDAAAAAVPMFKALVDALYQG